MDRIADALTTIKNSALVGKKFVEMPYSLALERILKVMKDEGFIENVKVFKPENQSFKMVHVDLKYEDGVSKISQITRISKPSRRYYQNKKELKTIAGGYGISVISTSQGIMAGKNARKKRLGGEVICYIV